MEFPLAPAGESFSGAFFDQTNFGLFRPTGVPAGVYPFTLFVYGGLTGANDFSLLGSDTTTITVTPEPSTLIFFGTGLAVIVGTVRRKLCGSNL